MTNKQTISILALSILMTLSAGVATAGIQVQNGDSSVKINRNGDIQIKNGRRRFYRSRVYRSPAIRVPSHNIYRQDTTNRGNCTTYRSTRQSGSGSNRSYAQTRTTTCQ